MTEDEILGDRIQKSLNDNTFVVWTKGLFYFRIKGRGLWIAGYRSHRPLFSERNGYRIVLFRWTNWWRVCWLSDNRKVKGVVEPPPKLRLVK